MQLADERFQVVTNLARLEAQDPEPAFVVDQPTRRHMPVPDAFLRGHHDLLQRELALRNLLLGADHISDVVRDHQNLVTALCVLERSLDRLELADLARRGVTAVFEDDLCLPTGHDGHDVRPKAIRHVRRNTEVVVVLADHLVRRGAIETSDGLVAQQEIAGFVLEEHDVRDLVEHRLEQSELAVGAQGGWGTGIRAM